MCNNSKRFVRLISCILTLAVFIGLLPINELRADANTHGEYYPTPFEVVYEQNSTWDNTTQGGFTVTNTSDESVDSWKFEIEYLYPVVVNNIWDANLIGDPTLPATTIIVENTASNGFIVSGNSINFGIIAQGEEAAPIAPIAVRLVTEGNEDIVPTPYPTEEITPTPTVTEIPEEITEVFPFVIFSGSNNYDFTFNGWKSDIFGDVYTGSNFQYNGSELTLDGKVQSVGNINASGWNITIGEQEEHAEEIDMPNWGYYILERGNELPVIDTSRFTTDDPILTDGYCYVDGDIVISGTTFEGDAIIIANGDITYNINEISGDGRVLLYSENGNITINGTEININGIMYAPNGRVSINAYKTTLNGRIVSDEFYYSGSILNCYADPSDLDMFYPLPEVNVIASTHTASIGDEVYYTIEISENNVYEIFYRLNGEDVTVDLPENEDEPIVYNLNTTNEGTFTFEAYIIIAGEEIILSSDTVTITVPNTSTPTPTEEPTDIPTPTEELTPTTTPTVEPTEEITPTVTDTPTITPEPTLTDVPTPTPDGNTFISMGDSQYGYQTPFVREDWTGDSSRVSPNSIYVTGWIWDSASCWYQTPIEMNENYSFSGRFTASIQHSGTPCHHMNLHIGPNNESVANSIAIHVDAYQSGSAHWKNELGNGSWNEGVEPYRSMVSICLNGDYMYDYAISEVDSFMVSGLVHDIWYSYDNDEKMIYIYCDYYDDDGNITRPETPCLVCPIDLEEQFDGANEVYLSTYGKTSLWDWGDFYIHGIEFNSGVTLDTSCSSPIQVIVPSNNHVVELGDSFKVAGRVQNETDECVIRVLDSNGEIVYENSVSAEENFNYLDEISTEGWSRGEHTLQVITQDSNGEEYISETTIIIHLTIEIGLSITRVDYIEEENQYDIYGNVSCNEDCTYILEYKNRANDEWITFENGEGFRSNELLGSLDANSLTSGDYIVRLTVTSATGVSKNYQSYFTYVEPVHELTNDELFIELDQTQQGQEITFFTDIIGTVTGSEFSYYELSLVPVDEENAIPDIISSADLGGEDIVVGTVDATLLINGFYRLTLIGYTSDGQSKQDEIVVLVKGQAKIGNYTISFLDMTLPVNALPVEVYRTYDSRNRNVMGDFGYGWDMTIGGPNVSVSGNLGDGWSQDTRSGIVGTNTYYWTEEYPHEIYIDWGNGHSETFEMQLIPESQQIVAMTNGISVSLVSQDGTSTLEIIDCPTADLMFVPGDMMLYTADMDEFIPHQFRLTTVDGTKYYFDVTFGLYMIEDTYGRTITIDDTGVHYSEGGSISINRDADGKITSISDGLGNEVIYTYDENSNLVSVLDIGGYTTTFEYDDSHYITGIIADNGSRIARNEYDDDGRLIATIDADGNRIEFGHDLDARREVTTNRLGYNTIYTYDERGNVLTVTDANNNVTSYAYDSNNNKTSETRPDGTVFNYTYDSNNNLTSATDSNGRTISSTYSSNGELLTMSAMGVVELSMVYDSHGNITSATDSSGNTQEYGYSNSGELTSVSDSIGTLMNMTYDSNGNVSSITNGNGQVANFTYDSEGRLTTRSVTYNGTTLTDRYFYDASNRVTGITYADGNTISYTYNQAGDVVSSADSQNRTTNYTYDLYGNLTRISYPDGTSESFTYDAEGQNISSTDRMGRTSTYSYDAVGNLIRVTTPEGITCTYTYDACDRVITATNGYGAVTTYGYDYLGRNTSVTDGLGNTTTYAYNDRGNVSSVTDANGNTYSFTYDNNGNQTSVTYPNGNAFSSTYDVRGRLTSETDGNGNTTTYSYDSLDQLISVTDANGSSWNYTYDSMGNVVSVTDANGNVTIYGYDEYGRCISTTNAAGITSTNTYDDYGRVTSSTDFGGHVTTYTYDSMDRVITSTTDGHMTTYEYDTLGRVTSVTDETGTITYEYSSTNGYLTSVTNANNQTITYTYNDQGQLTIIAYGTESIHYGYDVLGRITTVTDNEGTTRYSYDAVGNLTRTEYPNGVVTTYTYNENSILVLEETTDSTDTIIASYAYVIGDNNERLSVTELNRTVEYGYDNLNRLISETVTVSGDSTVTTYSYDANSNRISMVKDGVVTNYTYNNLNQLITAGNVTYTWDNAGNLVSQSSSGVLVATYTYDSYNRMVTASVVNGYQTIEQSYTYDYLGNRTSKTNNGETTNYLTDLSTGYAQILVETTGNEEIFYTRGLELISRRTNGEAQYYLLDGGSSVRGLTDEDGVITDTYLWDAFGNSESHTGNSSNEYGFQGEQQDETGLYYLRARYMNPATGTFTSMDTYGGSLSDPMSLHKYLFANANPVKYSDPSGLFSMSETMLVSAIISELAASTLYLVELFTTDNIQYDSLGSSIGGALVTVFSAILAGLIFGLLYSILAIIVSVTFASVIFALFGIPTSILGILNGVLNFKNGDGWLGAIEIIINSIFLIACIITIVDYTVTVPYNKRGGVNFGENNYSRRGAFRAAKRDAQIGMSQQPYDIQRVPMRTPEYAGGHVITDSNGPVYTREYYFYNKSGETVIIQDHSAGHSIGVESSHFNVRPEGSTRKGTVDGTLRHYPFN